VKQKQRPCAVPEALPLVFVVGTIDCVPISQFSASVTSKIESFSFFVQPLLKI
jgi:hypothetical protein